MLDAIIISDSGNETLSASSPLRLQLDGKVASIQYIKNFVENKGKIVNPVKGENEKNWHSAPKLNGIKLFSYLQSEGHRVALIDSFYQEMDDFLELLKYNPKAIIISTTFILNKKTLYKLAMEIRSVAPDVKIIAGGPFILSSYILLSHKIKKDYDIISPQKDYLFLNLNNRPDIDLYIIDKGGEQILSNALNKIKKGENLKLLPNTAYWTGSSYHFSERIDSNPIEVCIGWNNIPDRIFKHGVINVQASIGCPYRCKFCNFIKDHKFNYIKPLDKLIKELKSISARGVKYIRFVDDNFRLGKNDLSEVCKTFIEEGIDLKWMSFIRANALENIDPNLLKSAGCIETQMGIESADKLVLGNMNKGSDPEMYHKVISNLLNTGINCSCCFIVGYPGETSQTFEKTVNFIESIPKDSQDGIFYWSIYPFLLVPLSEIYTPEERSKYRLEGYMQNWAHSTMNSGEASNQIINAFLKIKNSSPIYSGDNIDMLNELSTKGRKKFVNSRHDLAKCFLNNSFDKNKVLNVFSPILDIKGHDK